MALTPSSVLTSAWNALPPSVRRSLEEQHPIVTVADGALIHRPGERAAQVWWVRRGHLSGFRGDDHDSRHRVCQSGSGEWHGWCCAMAGGNTQCTTVAHGEAEVMPVPIETFWRLIQDYPKFRLAVTQELGDRVNRSFTQAMDGRCSVDERLRHAVGRLVGERGRRLAITRRELAAMAGTTVESAIRTIQGWEEKGWVATGWGRLTVRRLAPFTTKGAKP